MEVKFVNLYNTFAKSHYKTSDAILKLRESRISQRKKYDDRINTVFNILAVSEGLRDVALMTIPKHFNYKELNLHYVEGLIANSKAMSKDELIALNKLYNGNNPSGNIEMGRRLGYLQPNIKRNEDIDGALSMVLHLPNTPYDAKMDKMYLITSEYGPQSVAISNIKNTRVRTMQEQWNKFATSIHPEFEIFVELMFY